MGCQPVADKLYCPKSLSASRWQAFWTRKLVSGCQRPADNRWQAFPVVGGRWQPLTSFFACHRLSAVVSGCQRGRWPAEKPCQRLSSGHLLSHFDQIKQLWGRGGGRPGRRSIPAESLLYLLEWRGGRTSRPNSLEWDPWLKREGFAVGAADAAAARGPGGGAIVLCDGLWRLGPEARETAKSAKKCDFQ